MRRLGSLLCAIACLFQLAGCARGLRQVQPVQGLPASIAELWQAPSDIRQRDLFHGAGGDELRPRDTSFTFVARDTSGWSPGFGKFTYPTLLRLFRLRGFGQGTRNDLDGFEAQGFIRRIDGSRVEFDYRGIYRDVINSVTAADVRWACGLLSRLSDQQWRDAFRAGGYNADQTGRYVAKIKAKIAEGLALTDG